MLALLLLCGCSVGIGICNECKHANEAPEAPVEVCGFSASHIPSCPC